MSRFIFILDSFLQKWIPDPFIIAAFLTFLVGFLAYFLTPSTAVEVVEAWNIGFWKLISFTLQMVMILIGGYLVASSPSISQLIEKICSLVKSNTQAIFVTVWISGLAAWLNWGLGLVVGAFIAVKMARHLPNPNFRVLVAASYSGFIFWHGGLSGSIPLVVNTEGNFSQEWIGATVPIQQTLFSNFNIIAILGLLILIPTTLWILSKSIPHDSLSLPPEEDFEVTAKAITPAEKLETSPIIPLLLFSLAGIALLITIKSHRFRLDLNTINFVFLFLGILLHWRTRSFLKAVNSASSKVGPILIQYPLYAGIMGIMKETGLAAQISDFFVKTSSDLTFPFFTFLGAGVVNFFVPSGGGQWAVQAPIVLPAAQQLGADLPLSIMAVAWGDSWTNMAQPFWALPLLAIAGLGVKHILGLTLSVLIVSGIYLGILLLLFSS